MRITIALLLTLMVAAPLAGQTRRPVAPRQGAALLLAPVLSGIRRAVRGRQDVRRRVRHGVGAAVLGRRRADRAAAQRVRRDSRLAFQRDRSSGRSSPAARSFPLGIPLTATVTPFEVTGGYRYRLSKVIIPYVAIGVGRYGYSEDSSFNDTGEDVSESHAGFVVLGGVEFRVHRWVGVGVDAEYTHVTGILGAAGISQAFGEHDLGGTSVRVKILVGR